MHQNVSKTPSQILFYKRNRINDDIIEVKPCFYATI